MHARYPQHRPLALALVALLAMSACGRSGDTGGSAGSAPTGAATPMAGRSPVAAGVTATPPGTFMNPVYATNFPDPHVIRMGETYYAYATNGGGANVQTLRSTDLVRWAPGEDAMPQLAEWVTPGTTWAPEVLPLRADRYILYYTAASTAAGRQCIGTAISSKPEGPFEDRSRRPLVCQADQGGSIDAHPFRGADGALYLYWKNDGNAVGMPTYIYGQRLSADGRRLAGRPARLVREDAPWEGELVEAPTMWIHEGRHYLFYSANAYYDETYAAGYATCEGPLGPCVKAPENPILSSNEHATGPGHQTIIRDGDGEEWFVYHAWPPDAVGSEQPGRVLWIDRLVWEGGKPTVQGPTAGSQPLP